MGTTGEMLFVHPPIQPIPKTKRPRNKITIHRILMPLSRLE